MKIENYCHLILGVIVLAATTFLVISCAKNLTTGQQSQQQESSAYIKIKLSEACINEILDIPNTKENFNLQEFTKDLPSEVENVKYKAKNPFSKSKDHDSNVTSLGITVGCAKEFPINPEEIESLLAKILFLNCRKPKQGINDPCP